MVRKYTGNKASVKTAEALAREGLKQEEKAEKAMEAQKKPAAVKKDMEQKGYTAREIQIYVNMEEAAAYYVLDGTAGEDYCVILR